MRLRGALALLLLLCIHGCHQGADARGDGFVRVQGTRFVLNGSPFFANGFNAYWLMTIGADPAQRGKVSSALSQAAGAGLTVARTWAFSDGGGNALQYSPGRYNENTFQGLDFVLSEARKHGIKMILSLVNSYDSFGGRKQYVQWAREQGQSIGSDDEFFTNPVVKGFYKNHIKHSAPRPSNRQLVRQVPGATHSDSAFFSGSGEAARASHPPPMIRAATVHARLLLSCSYVSQAKAAAASRWPLVSRKPSLLGFGRRFYQMDTRGQDENKVSTSRGCHTSPETQELAKKSCVPCNSKDLHPMSEDSAIELLEQVNGWELTTEGGILKLHRAWKVKNFAKGLEFFQLVAAIAEEEGHHPDLHLVGWNNVKIDVWTHSIRGLTDNDFILAAKINHLNLKGILSKRANVQK